MLPILMYHGLHHDAASPGRFDPVYSVRPDAFARQLDWLRDEGYRTVRLDDARRDARDVVITFDDGDVSNRAVALPLLRARGMVAEFFITSDFVARPGMLDADDVRALATAGMGIGAHGRSHALLEDLDDGALEDELRASRARLQVLADTDIDALALPGGRGGERERLAAHRLGYRHLLGSVPGPNREPSEDGWLQRMAVTRGTSLPALAALVRWRGLRPRYARARFAALVWPKRLLGNDAYARLRGRLL